MVEHLPTKSKAQSSNPSTIINKSLSPKKIPQAQPELRSPISSSRDSSHLLPWWIMGSGAKLKQPSVPRSPVLEAHVRHSFNTETVN
jgi:hypothetical protein